jgi:ribonuclease P protein component
VAWFFAVVSASANVRRLTSRYSPIPALVKGVERTDGEVVARADLSPQKTQAEKDARISGSDGDESGAQCHQAPPSERAMAVDRLMMPMPIGPKGTNRFPPSERLRRQKDIQLCMREGKRLRHPLLTLYVRWREGAGRQVAFSVGRRVAKKATVRNKIKRWLREAYRTKRWAMKEGVDMLIVAQPPCAATNFHAVNAALTELLWRAGVLILPCPSERERTDEPTTTNGNAR